MRILLVEDESRVSEFIQRGLSAEGCSILVASNAEIALELVQDETFDAIILDLMLPGMGGEEFCRQLRSRKDYTPILMLTALSDTKTKINGFAVGADDYLTKPFDFDELIARLSALVRRASGFNSDGTPSQILSACDVQIDLRSLRVTAGADEIELTVKEREILKLLMTDQGRVFSRERILNSVWGSSEDPLTNVVDVYVGRLRKKLGSHGRFIKTARGVGYRMSCD